MVDMDWVADNTGADCLEAEGLIDGVAVSEEDLSVLEVGASG